MKHLRFHPPTDEHAHAQHCAETIRAYWLAEGAKVQVQVVEIPGFAYNAQRLWGLRSDLKNGKPPK